MNKSLLVLLKKLNYQVKAKRYTEKVKNNRLNRCCIDHMIYQGVLKAYHMWDFSNVLRIYHHIGAYSKVFYQFIVIFGTISNVVSICERSFFLLRRDFPLGFFMLSTNLGIFSDNDICNHIDSPIIPKGGILLFWTS